MCRWIDAESDIPHNALSDAWGIKKAYDNKFRDAPPLEAEQALQEGPQEEAWNTRDEALTGVPEEGDDTNMGSFKKYRRRQIAELREWDGLEVPTGVSISDVDRMNGSPKKGDMIARNPKDHRDQWLVAKEYFEDNFEIITNTSLDRNKNKDRLEAEHERLTRLLGKIYGLIAEGLAMPPDIDTKALVDACSLIEQETEQEDKPNG